MATDIGPAQEVARAGGPAQDREMGGLKTALAFLLVGGAGIACATERPAESGPVTIRLRGFSSSNYSALNRNLGHEVCVTGRLSVDSSGIRFLLRPYERGDNIDPAPSRVFADLRDEQYLQNRFVNRGRYTICGMLRDATPWDRCDYTECKWYRLEHAEVRRRP
jgi:hypothetical protein